MSDSALGPIPGAMLQPAIADVDRLAAAYSQRSDQHLDGSVTGGGLLPFFLAGASRPLAE